MTLSNHICDKESNLHLFNERNVSAFENIYILYHRELESFAAKLYYNTEIDAVDVVHDSFLTIWDNKKIVFEDITKIKPYLYAIIRNGYRNYIVKQKVQSKYMDMIANDDDYYKVKIAENEIQSIIKESKELLPNECSEIFEKLVNGWNIKEVAEKFNCSERTVYNRKYEAIKILKSIFTKEKMFIIIQLLGH